MATQLEVKRATKREKDEERLVYEVNSRVNHSPQLRVTAGMTHSKTMHHGVDLTSALAKYSQLCVIGKISPKRVRFGIALLIRQEQNNYLLSDAEKLASMPDDRFSILLVDMPRGWLVMSPDDFIYKLDEYPCKVIEMAEKVGLWEYAGDE